MQYTPKAHQKYCIDRLTKTGRPESAGLLLDMGLGKTSTSLTAIATFLWEEFSVSKVLVIAPLRVAEDTWTTEAEKWDHLKDLRISAILGDRKKRIAALEADADIYVINRENVEWLCDPKLSGMKKWMFDLVVIDELSSFKNNQSKRWRALKRRMPPGTPVWGLTGTIAPKGYIDLWPQIYLLDGGQRLEKTLGAFREKFFTPGARKGHIVYEWRLKEGSKERIDAKLSDICISMRKEDWIDLPPVTFNRVVVKMDKKERAVYEELKREKVLTELEGKDLDSAIVGATAAALSGKLLQLAGGSLYDEDGGTVQIHSRKLDALEELQEAAQGQPLLVFYAFKHEAQRIMQKFPKAVQMGVDEGKDTSAVIRKWNAGEIPMLLCHPASAGHGLNLQAGGHIAVWYGLPWSLELYLQANARLHRMGQTKPVVIHHIVCADTLDEKVLTVLGQREADQNALLNALKAYVTK
jgi:SNF2 family DNA or RNA helicase